MEGFSKHLIFLTKKEALQPGLTGCKAFLTKKRLYSLYSANIHFKKIIEAACALPAASDSAQRHVTAVKLCITTENPGAPTVKIETRPLNCSQ